MNTTAQPELIPMGPGDLLRQAREKHGWALDSVAREIKLRPEVLRAIEAGETSQIPPVYLKGYIRNYARHVGISGSVIEQHLSHAKGSDPLVQPIFKQALPRNKGDRWFKASSYLLASAVVIALVWQFTNEAVRFSQGDPLIHTAQTESNALQPSPEIANYSNAETKTGTEAVTANTHLRASIAAMNLSEDQTGTNRPLVAEGAWAAIGNRDAVLSKQNSGHRESELIEIVTSADSWVEIVDHNGEKIEMDLLRAGSRRSYTGAAPFRMLLGRASSVEVFHNGEKVNLAPYIRGNVARLTLGVTETLPESDRNPDPESPAMDAASPDQS